MQYAIYYSAASDTQHVCLLAMQYTMYSSGACSMLHVHLQNCSAQLQLSLLKTSWPVSKLAGKQAKEFPLVCANFHERAATALMARSERHLRLIHVASARI
jgi:hypothetical protein